MLKQTPKSRFGLALDDKFEALKREIKRLVTQGILAESDSPWAGPFVMVKKPSGEYHLCADFVALNKILKVPRYAVPNINDFSAMAHGCSWFSSIDIKDVYYHISVRPADSHKLTITTPIGNFKYLLMPRGLGTSSGYFQKLMNEVLSGLPQMFVYLDDIIIIMSSSLEDHERLLNLVFKTGRAWFSCEHKKMRIGRKPIVLFGTRSII